MAFNYKCGQFDDSFSAKRLGNWGDRPRTSRCLKTRRGVYFRQKPLQPQHPKLREFIANDCGHLLPDVKENICKKTNHWGYPVVGVWDELFQCCDGSPQKKPTCDKERTLSFDDMPQFFRTRSPLAVCANSGSSVLDNYNMKYTLELEFERLQSRCPPVIWIYGQPQKAIEDQRLKFAGGLAKKLSFIYINPERVLTVLAMRYLHYSPRKTSRAWYWSKDGESGGFFSVFTELPTILLDCPPSIQRIVALLKNIICHQPTEAFNTLGILEIIKMLFITFPSARGYVVDGFPVTVSEGDDYEKEFWPVAVGLYFTSQQWRESKKRGCNPALVHPNFFVRSSDYWESLVETAANEFGESCMKVEDAECLDQRDFCYIVNVVKDVIKKYNAAMCKEKMEFDPDDECDIKPKIYCVESSTTSSPESEERSSTSSESSPTRVEEPREVAKVDSPESSDSDSDSLEDYDPALERTILDEFDVPKIKVTVRRKVDAFYQHPGEVYSHYIPDKAGVETEFRTGIRRHHVADILDMKPRKEDETPLTGKLLFTDPSKPDYPRPIRDHTLFPDDGKEDTGSDDILLDEEAYVEKALELEKQKLKRDIADRKYRRRNLPYTTYRTEPPAHPETIHTLFPPEKRDFKDIDEFSHLKPRAGERGVRYEDQLRDVFHPEEKVIIQEDEEIQRTYVPNADWFDTPEQLLQFERTRKGYDRKQSKKAKKKTLFDKVKGKWVKFRRYIKPVPRPKVLVGAAEKIGQWNQQHPTDNRKSRGLQRKGEEEEEFRYD